MKPLAIVLCLLILVSACRSNSARLPTTPSVPSSSSATVSSVAAATVSAVPSAITVIAVGKEVTDALQFHGAEKTYELTAPSDGTLVARLGWAPIQGRLQLDLAGTPFANFPDNLSPIVGKLPVAAGVKYRIRVADGAPWDYDDLSLPYVLTIVIE
jgi:hypothetical protein